MAEAEKEKKKQLPRVGERLFHSKYGSNIAGIAFGWVSSPEHGRVQASYVGTCREALCGAPFRYVMQTTRDESTHIFGKDAPIDFSRLRLLVVNPGDIKRSLFKAKAMINIIEAHLGWNKSTISTVVHPNYDNAWLITGPGEWMRQPQFVSIYALLLRWFTARGPMEASNMVELDTLVRKRLEIRLRMLDDDSNNFMAPVWPHLITLLMRHDEIFITADPEVVWRADGEHVSFYSGSGIRSFMNNTAKYNDHVKAAAARFSELRETGI